MSDDCDSANWDKLTPEQRERFDDVMRRIEEVKCALAEANAQAASSEDLPERQFRLLLELLELQERITPADELDEAIAAKERFLEQVKEFDRLDAAWKRIENPTPAERVLRNFADKLATRQGTQFPDFEALYRQRAKLDRKINESGN